MTDFDKLIKEKAEQAEYAYKPSAWKSFQRHAGMARGGLKYWVAGVSSVVAIGGLTTFLMLRTSHPTLENEPSPKIVAVDTLSSDVDEIVLVENDTTSMTQRSEQKASRVKAAPSAASKSSDEKSSDETSQPAKAATCKKNDPPRYGRPVVIDVDTIKDNVPSDDDLRNGHSRLY